MKGRLIERMRNALAGLAGKNSFGRMDFVILKTTLMLAAVDGEIADDEVCRFREFAAKCRGYSGESFETLWEAAIRSAGYLLMQSHFLGQEELAEAFVKEAEKDFVGEVVLETADERTRAFEFLDGMAMADGDYSGIERACIAALVRKVAAARERLLDERYPRAAKFDRSEDSVDGGN